MKRRVVSILLALVMAVSLLPVQVMGAAVEVNYSQLSCDTYVEDTEKRNYINQAMQKYLERYEELRKTLEDGNAIIFFFEGGSDYAKAEMELADGDSRYNAEVLVVKKENGTAQVVYGNGCCSTVPDNPALYGYFSSGSGPETICDGIYQTVTKTKQTSTTSKALHLVPVSSDRAIYLNKNYEKGYLKGSFGSKIDIHRSYYSVPHTELAEAGSKSNSLGCLTVAKNTDSSNYEAFIKVVTGYDNAWREGYSTEGNTVGYTVVDRQLFKTQLTSLYDGNEAAIDALTVHSEDLVTPIEPEPSPTYADIPTVTSAYASEQAVTVNWSAAANAVSYDVYLEQDGSVRKSRTGCSGLSVTFYGVEYGTYNAYVIANPAKDRNQISNTFAVEVVAPDKVVVESGYCGGEGDGENLKWELDSEGTLTIRGEGKMKDYSYNDYVPWRDCNIINRVKKVLISNGVTSLEDWAFCGCSELSSITIPDSVTSIGDYTFEACTNLKSVAIPESVASIGIKTFGDCTKLTNIIIPDSVISIGSFAFSWCENLSSITISNNVTSIDEFTFYECKNLDNITIPTSVTYIDAVAFGGCDKLRDVYYSGSEAEWAKITIEDYNESLTSVTIHFNSTPQPEKKPTVTAAGTTQEVKVGTNGKMTVTVPNVVNNKAATVTFDQAAVEKISGYGDLTLTVRDNTANLSSNLKNAVEVKGKNAASIVITLTSADGTPVFTEGTSAGKAVVTIPYKAGLLSKNIKVFYVNGDKLTSQEFTYNQLTGVVTLTLEHFSEYLITSESEAVPTPTPAVTTQRRRYTAATATAAADTKVNSASTFDAGVGIYAVSAILSVTGMAWAGRKKH